MRDFLRFTARFLSYTLGRNRRIVSICIALISAGYVASALLAWAMQQFTDALTAHDRVGAAVAVGGVILLLVVSRAEPLLTDYVAVHQYFNASNDLENHLLAIDLTFPHVDHLEDASYVDRFQMLQGDVENLVKIVWTWVRILSAGLQTIVSTLLLARVHPLLTLFPIAVAPLLFADARSRTIRDRGRMASTPHVRLEAALTDILVQPGSAKEPKVARAEPALNGLADDAWARSSDAIVRSSLRAEALSYAGWLFFVAVQIAVVAWVGVRVAHGQAGLGDVILVITLGLQSRHQFGTFVWNASRGLSTQIAFRRYRELLEMHKTKTLPITDPVAPPERVSAGIRLEGVSFTYPGTDRASLSDVDLELPTGATVAIVGENGAGKTTLVKLLCGLYAPTAGRITIDGLDLSRIEPDQWRQRIAALFQDFAQLQLTAGEAIGVGDLPSIDDPVALNAAVHRANAVDVIDGLPRGYATQLGKQFADGVELSGGQWQRLALAQAMMRMQPLLLVLDEPASALDPFAEHDLFERYAEAAKSTAGSTGTVTVFVSHRFSTVLMADLIIVLDAGRVVEVGGHKQLLAQSGIYAELYKLQRDAYDTRL